MGEIEETQVVDGSIPLLKRLYQASQRMRFLKFLGKPWVSKNYQKRQSETALRLGYRNRPIFERYTSLQFGIFDLLREEFYSINDSAAVGSRVNAGRPNILEEGK